MRKNYLPINVLKYQLKLPREGGLALPETFQEGNHLSRSLSYKARPYFSWSIFPTAFIIERKIALSLETFFTMLLPLCNTTPEEAT